MILSPLMSQHISIPIETTKSPMCTISLTEISHDCISYNESAHLYSNRNNKSLMCTISLTELSHDFISYNESAHLYFNRNNKSLMCTISLTELSHDFISYNESAHLILLQAIPSNYVMVVNLSSALKSKMFYLLYV